MEQRCNLAAVWLTWLGLPLLALGMGIRVGLMAGLSVLGVGIVGQLLYLRWFPYISRWMGYGSVADTPADDSSALPVSEVAAIVVLPASSAKSPAWTLNRPTAGRSGSSTISPEASAFGATEQRPSSLQVLRWRAATRASICALRRPRPRTDASMVADPRHRKGPRTPRAPSTRASTSAAKSF